MEIPSTGTTTMEHTACLGSYIKSILQWTKHVIVQLFLPNFKTDLDLFNYLILIIL